MREITRQRVIGGLVLVTALIIVVPILLGRFMADESADSDQIVLTAPIAHQPARRLHLVKPPQLAPAPTSAEPVVVPPQSTEMTTKQFAHFPWHQQVHQHKLFHDRIKPAQVFDVHQKDPEILARRTPSAKRTPALRRRHNAKHRLAKRVHRRLPATSKKAHRVKPTKTAPTVDPSISQLQAFLKAERDHRAQSTVRHRSTRKRLQQQTRPSWTVQIGTFSQIRNATHLLKRLQAAGYTAYTHKTYTRRGTFIKVFAGVEPTRRDARHLLSSLKRRFKLKGIVVRRTA